MKRQRAAPPPQPRVTATPAVPAPAAPNASQAPQEGFAASPPRNAESSSKLSMDSVRPSRSVADAAPPPQPAQATAAAPAPASPRAFAPEPGSPQAAPRPAAPAAMRVAPSERREALSQGAAKADAPILDAEAAKVASPEAQLERIARLREAQRDEEADRALEEFRRRNPDYRIPAALWERVRGR